MVHIKRETCQWNPLYVRCIPLSEEGEVIGEIYFEEATDETDRAPRKLISIDTLQVVLLVCQAL